MEQNQDTHLDHRTTLLEWEAPEFVPSHRGRTWYIVAGLVMSAFVVYALFTDSLTMAIVFILLAVVFLLVEKREPRTLRVVITDMGVQYNGQFYPYHHINAFWIVYHPPHVELLYLRLSNGRKYTNLRIELNRQKPQEIRQLLLDEIPEIEGAIEPMTDLLARILRLQ